MDRSVTDEPGRTSSRRTEVLSASVGVLLVGGIGVALGLGAKAGQLESQCSELPGLGTTLGWLGAIGIGLLILIVGGIVLLVSNTRRPWLALFAVSGAAPIGFAIGLALGAYGPDPCGFLEPPTSVGGRAQVQIAIDTPPFVGRSIRRGSCELEIATGAILSLSSMPDIFDTTSKLSDWFWELNVDAQQDAGPHPSVLVMLGNPDLEQSAWYDNSSATGWEYTDLSDGRGRLAFDALPLVPGAEWAAPMAIKGSVEWVCVEGEP